MSSLGRAVCASVNLVLVFVLDALYLMERRGALTELAFRTMHICAILASRFGGLPPGDFVYRRS